MNQALYAHMNNKRKMKKKILYWVSWLMPVVPATWEADMQEDCLSLGVQD
jgi:hypothetical protein